MTLFALARLGFALLGTYFVCRGLIAGVSAFANSFVMGARFGGIDAPMLFSGIALVAAAVVPGILILALSQPIAYLLFRDRSAAVEIEDPKGLLTIAIGVLGLYFCVSGGFAAIQGAIALASLSGLSAAADLSTQTAAYLPGSLIQALGGFLLYRYAWRVSRWVQR